MGEFDVTKNIQMTEKLKCRLLSHLSALYSSMNEERSTQERTEILSDLLIDTYRMGQVLGIPFDGIDRKAVSKMKAAALDDNTDVQTVHKLQLLIRHVCREE